MTTKATRARAGLLTDVAVRAWVKAEKPGNLSDGAGLALTMSKAGTCAWVLRFSHGGKQREVTLGRYPDISIKRAREIAAEKRVEVSQGVDVALAKQARKAAEAAPDTVKALCEEFYDRTIKGRLKRPDLVRAKLDNDIIRAMGRKKMGDVKPLDIDRMISQIVERGSAVMANRVLSLTKEVFDYAIRRHWIDVNPAGAFRAKDAGGEEAARKRALKDAEVTKLLKALDNAGPAFRVYALAVRLLLLTGVRRAELIEAAWSEFDLDAGTWTIPAERKKTGKNGRPFVVPLTLVATGWFKELQLLGCNSDYVFPPRRRGSRVTMGPNTLNWALDSLNPGGAVF